jgi:hypothetical protein
MRGQLGWAVRQACGLADSDDFAFAAAPRRRVTHGNGGRVVLREAVPLLPRVCSGVLLEFTCLLPQEAERRLELDCMPHGTMRGV